MPLEPGTRLGRYEILNFIGAGGMGEVYRGRDTRLDRDVAIKILPRASPTNPTRRARFEREARAISAAQPPAHLHDLRRRRTGRHRRSSSWNTSRASRWRRGSRSARSLDGGPRVRRFRSPTAHRRRARARHRPS